MIRTSELAQKDVITVKDGMNLGPISDIELNLEEGRVEALIVPGPGRILGLFSRDKEYIIPWNNIVNIGVDVILVELKEGIEPQGRETDD